FGQAPQRGLPQAISPSSVTTQTFQTKYGEDFDYGRPPHSGSIPLALLHEVFGEFIEDVQSCTPNARDNQHMLKLCEKMIQIHESEATRALSFREIWEEFIPYPLEAGIIGGSSFATDGHIRRNRYFLVITEAKRELEGMKPDPLIQAAMYYLQALQPFKNSNGLFPCLLIYYAGMLSESIKEDPKITVILGSYIGFAGAVWNEKIQIEVLTPFYPLQGNPHQRNIRLQVARALAATRRAVTSLETHYNNLVIPPSVEENIIKPVSFPYRTYYESQGEVSQRQRIKFTYQKRIFDNRLMFIAKNTAGRLLFVKFTQRYSATAHKHCAEQGIAPTLYAAEKLPGVYRDTETRTQLHTKIKRATEILHSGGFVHGDLRGANVMVRKNWKENTAEQDLGVMLLDFDWAGEAGKVRYPANLNCQLYRPEGVEDGVVITVDHDVDMVDHILD
ncbi:15526_t:CDS:1, partial [Acaulospora colombiana]